MLIRPASLLQRAITDPIIECNPADIPARLRMLQGLGSSVVFAIALTVTFYLERSDWILNLALGLPRGTFREVLLQQYYVPVRVFGYIVLPLMAGRWMFKLNARDLGFGLGDSFRFWRYPFWFYVLTLPFLIAASRLSGFGASYMHLRFAGMPPSGVFFSLLMAFIGLISTEAIFRGFAIHASKAAFGGAAVFFALVPNCLIHFQKPFVECLGSIVFGLALGSLSLRTRSIWGGLLVHAAVALTMELCFLIF